MPNLKKGVESAQGQKRISLPEKESQPRRPLGLSYWQKKRLQKLSARELEKKNMA